jgi:HEAT repeat protein
MDPIIVSLAVAAGLAGLSALGATSASRRRKRREGRLEAVAEVGVALGLADVTMEGADLEGRHGSLRVRIETSSAERVRPVGRLVVRGLTQGLSVQRDGLLARVGEAPRGPVVETGDEAFDQALYVRGQALVARALLDADTRALCLAAICGRTLGRGAAVAVAEGVLSAELAGEWSEDTPQRVEGARVLVALAHRLEEPDAKEERLSRIARTDALPRVRQLALETLADAAPAHELTGRALRRACDDPDPAIRLRAALLAGGKPARRALRALAERTDVPDEVSATTVDEIGGRMAVADLGAMLGSALRARPKTDLAAVRALARGGPAVVPTLVAALPRLADDAVAAAAEVLRAIGVRGAESALIAAVARPDATVRIAVAHALGALGSVRAVPVLRGLEADGGDVRSAARAAVAAIQSRLGGASSGQLALAEPDGGHLALAEGDGRLTLDPRDE